MTVQPSADKRGGAALCCECGNLRTNGPKTVARDPNRSASGVCDYAGHPQRWRMTRTIYCPVCEMPTRHAMLCSAPARDVDEEWDHKQVRRRWERAQNG
jgi:hypothetical protein